MSNPAQSVPNVYHVLLAARGNPDHGQHPDQPPLGVGPDQVKRVGSMMEAVNAVNVFIRDNDLGGGNWVGGDVWMDGQHVGCIAYNGRLFDNEKGPLVREGRFVFIAKSQGQATSIEARLAEVVRQFLHDPLSASRNVAAFQAGRAALDAFDESQSIPTIDLDQEAWRSIKQAASESTWMPKEYFANDWTSDVCRFLRNGIKPEPASVAVVMEGGAITAVLTDGTITATLVDYDAEDHEPETLREVPQDRGGTATAHVADLYVEQSPERVKVFQELVEQAPSLGMKP